MTPSTGRRWSPRRKRLLGLILLLVLSHWPIFSKWSEESFWIFVVDVIILLLILFREYIWDIGAWILGRHHGQIDSQLLEFLSKKQVLSAEEISRQMGLPKKKIDASLGRLLEKQHVDLQNGVWRKVM